jgi:hypothetical protein
MRFSLIEEHFGDSDRRAAADLANLHLDFSTFPLIELHRHCEAMASVNKGDFDEATQVHMLLYTGFGRLTWTFSV